MVRRMKIIGIVFSLFLFACGSDAGTDIKADAAPLADAATTDGSAADATAVPDANTADAAPLVDPLATEHTYVVQAVQLPEELSDVQTLGLDVDNDPMMKKDNALGTVLWTVKNQSGSSVQPTIDEYIAKGQMLMLVNLMTTDLFNAEAVGLWYYLGDKNQIAPEPCLSPMDTTCGQHLSGNGEFVIAGDAPLNSAVYGAINSNEFFGVSAGDPMRIEIPIYSGGDPLQVDLVGAKIKISQITEAGLFEGILAGGLPTSEIDGKVIPALRDLFNSLLIADCDGTPENCPGSSCDPCGCQNGSAGDTIRSLFDKEPAAGEPGTAFMGVAGDCMITIDELRNNNLIRSLLSPDVDLLNCPSADSAPSECTYEPRVDGIKESMSLGLGFRGAKGTFNIPASNPTN